MIRLYITPDEQQPYLLSFERSNVSVGSAADSDVRLRVPGVSGRHFRLRRVGTDVVIEDLGSGNGTYVNNLKISGARVLSPSDEIRIVGFCIRIAADGVAAVAVSKPAEAPGRAAPTVRATAPAVTAGRGEGAGRAAAPGGAGRGACGGRDRGTK